MIFHRRFSNGLVRCGDVAIRLLVWAVFSAVCYFAVAILPFNILAAFTVGGWVGEVINFFTAAFVTVTVCLYVYCSLWIFYAKEFPFSW